MYPNVSPVSFSEELGHLLLFKGIRFSGNIPMTYRFDCSKPTKILSISICLQNSNSVT